MIAAQSISASTVKIIVLEEIKANDFMQLAPRIDSIIQQLGKIRLLIDATDFDGWENIAA